MRDPELDSLVQAIESWLTRHAGREHVLSPADFRLARSWLKAGIPLADVLSALDGAAAAGEAVRSLAFCRGRVEAGGRTPRRR